jgi:hypothetical protein
LPLAKGVQKPGSRHLFSSSRENLYVYVYGTALCPVSAKQGWSAESRCFSTFPGGLFQCFPSKLLVNVAVQNRRRGAYLRSTGSSRRVRSVLVQPGLFRLPSALPRTYYVRTIVLCEAQPPGKVIDRINVLGTRELNACGVTQNAGHELGRDFFSQRGPPSRHDRLEPHITNSNHRLQGIYIPGRS